MKLAWATASRVCLGAARNAGSLARAARALAIGGVLALSPGLVLSQEAGDADEPYLAARLICALLGPDIGQDDPIPDDAEAFRMTRYDTRERGSAFILEPGDHVSFAWAEQLADGSWMVRGWRTRDGSPPYTTLMTLMDSGAILVSKPMGGGGSATFGGRCEDWPME